MCIRDRCLEYIGHSANLSKYRDISLEELVHEHLSAMLAEEKNLGKRFRPTIDALPIKQRRLLEMCCLFTGPITEGVLAFVRYFLYATCPLSEMEDYSCLLYTSPSPRDS